MESKKSDSIWMQHNPDEELLLDSVSKFITDLQEENDRFKTAIINSRDAIINGNRSWDALSILEEALK